MSEKEKKTGGGADSSLVLVEKTTVSRHKQPFRPTEMQEDAPPSDLHKRSKAPAVPSVAEELKESVHTDNKDRKETKNSETHLHSASKKISNTKKRPSSPEAINLAPMQTDAKRSVITPSQPIPDQVSSIPSAAPDKVTDKNLAEQNDEDDSITEEIAELRSPEVAKKSSEWVDNAGDSNKKEVSWNDEDYLEKIKLEECSSKGQPYALERKTSIGPCYRSAAPYGRPSGITICLSKKSASAVNEEYNHKKSVINITVSKKCLINKTIHRTENDCNLVIKDTIKEVPEASTGHILGSLRHRIANMSKKIRNVFG